MLNQRLVCDVEKNPYICGLSQIRVPTLRQAHSLRSGAGSRHPGGDENRF